MTKHALGNQRGQSEGETVLHGGDGAHEANIRRMCRDGDTWKDGKGLMVLWRALRRLVNECEIRNGLRSGLSKRRIYICIRCSLKNRKEPLTVTFSVSEALRQRLSSKC